MHRKLPPEVKDADPVGFYEIKNKFGDSLTLQGDHRDSLVPTALEHEQGDNKSNSRILRVN